MFQLHFSRTDEIWFGLGDFQLSICGADMTKPLKELLPNT